MEGENDAKGIEGHRFVSARLPGLHGGLRAGARRLDGEHRERLHGHGPGAVLQGGKDDQCQATHLGYILKGKLAVRRSDGVEETFEAGDAFLIEPGHTPIMFAGCEFVAFTRTDEAKQQTAVMMPNIMTYAQEHGIELPGLPTPA